LLAVFFDHSEFRAEIYEFKIDVRSQPLRLLSAAPTQLCAARLLRSAARIACEKAASRSPDGPQRRFRHPEDARWNAERRAVEFGVEIGERRGGRVPRRAFQRLLPDFLSLIVGLLSGTDGVGTSPATGSRR
jgi:hypothetical protein